MISSLVPFQVFVRTRIFFQFVAVHAVDPPLRPLATFDCDRSDVGDLRSTDQMRSGITSR